jgi:O-antigen/teichoic acid export membrane protein
LKKLVTLISGVVLLLLGLMFSVVVLVGVVVVGLLVLGYLWWKTREIRRVMREAPVNRQGGDVIEGEAVVVDDSGA